MAVFIRDGFTFDDILLSPQHSTIKSRSSVDLSVKWGALEFDHPIIPANMKTVTGLEMAEAILLSNGLAILHRFMPIEEQLAAAIYLLNNYDNASKRFAMSVGIKPSDKENIKAFIDIGIKLFCIDVAHGDSDQCAEMTSWIKEKYPNDSFVISGNVATGEGARRLWQAGANVVKIGIGGGSLCTTRIETGNGVPQLTALMDVSEVQREMVELNRTRDKENNISRQYPFIADGGLKNSGDIVKALCFADMVMVGNLFSGCDEAPGQVMSIDGHTYKEYVGSSTHKTNHIEGVTAIVQTKGTYKNILSKLLEGLRSGMSYQNAHDLIQLKDNPEFIKITNAGLVESHPHDVRIIK
jgi:IMP dehydrogenase